MEPPRLSPVAPSPPPVAPTPEVSALSADVSDDEGAGSGAFLVFILVPIAALLCLVAAVCAFRCLVNHAEPSDHQQDVASLGCGQAPDSYGGRKGISIRHYASSSAKTVRRPRCDTLTGPQHLSARLRSKMAPQQASDHANKTTGWCRMRLVSAALRPSPTMQSAAVASASSEQVAAGNQGEPSLSAASVSVSGSALSEATKIFASLRDSDDNWKSEPALVGQGSASVGERSASTGAGRCTTTNRSSSSLRARLRGELSGPTERASRVSAKLRQASAKMARRKQELFHGDTFDDMVSPREKSPRIRGNTRRPTAQGGAPVSEKSRAKGAAILPAPPIGVCPVDGEVRAAPALPGELASSDAAPSHWVDVEGALPGVAAAPFDSPQPQERGGTFTSGQVGDAGVGALAIVAAQRAAREAGGDGSY